VLLEAYDALVLFNAYDDVVAFAACDADSEYDALVALLAQLEVALNDPLILTDPVN